MLDAEPLEFVPVARIDLPTFSERPPRFPGGLEISRPTAALAENGGVTRAMAELLLLRIATEKEIKSRFRDGSIDLARINRVM